MDEKIKVEKVAIYLPILPEHYDFVKPEWHANSYEDLQDYLEAARRGEIPPLTEEQEALRGLAIAGCELDDAIRHLVSTEQWAKREVVAAAKLGIPKKVIADRLGVPRKTVRKWLEKSADPS